MDEILELRGVTNEEHGRVVAHQIEVALVGVELQREAARITDSAGKPSPPATWEKRANTGVRLPTPAEKACLGVLGDVLGDLEEAVRAPPLACTTRSGTRSRLKCWIFCTT